MQEKTAGKQSVLRNIVSLVRENKEKSAIIAAVAVLCIMIAVICCPSPAVESGDDPVHGITWSLRADGTLKFEGDGEIVGPDAVHLSEADAAGVQQPDWYAFRDSVTAIDIGRDIRHVGLDSFVNFTALETVTVRGAMTEVDFECIRYDTPEGSESFRSVIVWGPAESSARVYAEYNSLEFRTL
ncbi:MAG: hypothetical protein E7554_10870 [Ruminococcaceae bacterium]|nr:hypothetical protein [Oscillospiraceae bacterium]